MKRNKPHLPGSRLFGLLAFLIVLFAPAFASAGSPFYLTVERSFSSTESPELRLDYTATREPLLLRVLRARNVESFLDGQMQISRSYEEPATELNPGHYVLKGLNKAKSPLVAFRESLDVEFRRTLKKDRFDKALQMIPAGDRVSPPEEFVHGPPAGFDVVREHYVDLQFGGENMKDLGWWFGESGWAESRYKVRTISLEPLPDGLYLLQAVQGSAEAQSLLQVSSLSLQVKQSSGQLLLRLVDRTLNPVPGAAAHYRDGRGKWQAIPGKTDNRGELKFENPEGVLDGKLVIRATAPDKRSVFADTDFTPAVSADHNVFIVTDRPIFKPGEEFFFKGTIRTFSDGRLTIPPFKNPQARVSLVRVGGEAADLESVVPLSGFGSFSGSFRLNELQKPGLYTLLAAVDEKPYAGEFRVRDYVKPTFYLELLERGPVVVPGQPFKFRFRAQRFSGGTPEKVKYEVTLYRKRFEAPAFAVEAAGGLDAGHDYYGEVKSASGLMQPQRIYSSVEERLAGSDMSGNTWASAPEMLPDGTAAVEFTVPEGEAAGEDEWIYSLLVRAQDAVGSQAVLTENVYMTLSEAVPSVRFTKPVVQLRQQAAEAAVRSTYPDGTAAPRAGGVLELTLRDSSGKAAAPARVSFVTDEQGYAKVPVPALKRQGKLQATAVLETLDNKPMRRPARSQPAVLIIGGKDGEPVADNAQLELFASATVLSPGEKTKVLALLPAGWGQSEHGTVWETFAGSRIHSTNSRGMKGRSQWFEVEAKPEYGTGFYHTVTLVRGDGKFHEETTGFRIVPWEKRLTINVHPSAETAEPLREFPLDIQVLDARGEPAPEVELSVNIVDRAVYSVQPEFRPGILDFFYPLPRLNLATFYSDELQGYGYADLLKKPNFSLTALKSQTKITKKSMRDTAGWFPHVVTDGQGRARIVVNMPANITEWVVTAVAADKDGRAGEGRGKFRSAVDLNAELVLPQYVREGDEVRGSLRLVNHSTQDALLRLQTQAANGVSLQSMPAAELPIKPQEERIEALALSALAAGTGLLTLELQSEPALKLGGMQEYELPVKEAAFTQMFSAKSKGSAPLRLTLPQAAKPQAMTVHVVSGLLGAALGAASGLISYPYGCTEQLVHSTVPNLVLLNLIKTAGIKPEELGPLAEPFSRARDNAERGLNKLKNNQRPDGGFVLWPSETEPSFPVTLIAMKALSIAKQLDVEGAAGMLDRAGDWIDRNVEQYNFNHGGSRALEGYELAALAGLSGWNQPYERQAEYVKAQLTSSSAEHLIYALRILRGYEQKPWHRFHNLLAANDAAGELAAHLAAALEKFSVEHYAGQSREDFSQLGFPFGPAHVISAGLSLLEHHQAGTPQLRSALRGRLIAEMENGMWASTFDTAQVIFNLQEVLGAEAAAAAGQTGRELRVVAAAGSREIGSLAAVPGGFRAEIANPGTASQLSELRVEGLGGEESVYIYLRASLPYGEVRAAGQGLTLTRTIFRILPGEAVPYLPAEADAALKTGDVLISKISVARELTKNAGEMTSEFVVVEDPIPAIAEALENDAAYLADAKLQPNEPSYWARVKDTMRHPDKTVRIVRLAPGASFEAYQVYRAAYPGRASLPPAEAFDMYNESIRANTAASSLKVD